MPAAAEYVAAWEVPPSTQVVVVVDVLRAFTTAAYALAGGATEIYLVETVAQALALAHSMPGSLVMGEDHGRRPAGFDFNNSPVAIAAADVAGRSLVQRTSAGTGAVAAVAGVPHVFAASLVCASATARAVRQLNSGAPTYVISGRFQQAMDAGYDDLVTAELIERARLGQPLRGEETASAVAASDEAAITLALGQPHVDPDDIAFATAVDTFAFAMRVEAIGGLQRLTPVRPSAS